MERRKRKKRKGGGGEELVWDFGQQTITTRENNSEHRINWPPATEEAKQHDLYNQVKSLSATSTFVILVPPRRA